MRLDIYTYNYAPEPTGIAVYATGMAEWFAAMGWDVHVHTGRPWYPSWEQPRDWAWRSAEEMNGVTVSRVRQFIPQKANALGRICLDVSWLIRTAWKSLFIVRRPQVLVFISPPFLGGLLGLWLSWRWRVPFVYHVQDLQVDAAIQLRMLPSFMNSFLKSIERYILQRADLVTTISPGMRRRLQSTSGSQKSISLLLNWADIPGKLCNGAAFRLKWKIDEGDLIVAYSGSVGKKQGLEILVEAFASLSGDQRVHLVIAAGGSGMEELRHIIKGSGLDRIHLMELVPKASLGDFLAAADVHCVIQRRAASDLVLPSKLMNLLAHGRPVVVTADPNTDLARLVRCAGAGEVVEPENVQTLVAALRRLLDDVAYRKQCSDSGRQFAMKHLQSDTILNAFAQTLRGVVESKPGRRQ